jgi:translation initiation factor IF-2
MGVCGTRNSFFNGMRTDDGSVEEIATMIIAAPEGVSPSTIE